MNHKWFALVALIAMCLVLVACGAPTVESPPDVASPDVASPSVEPEPSATTAPPTATPTTSPSPTPDTPTAAPTQTPPPPTAEPTATPGDTLSTIPAVNCCRGRTLNPGQYEVPPWLGLPLAFELGEGWKTLNEEGAKLFLLGRGENVLRNPSQLVAFMNATSGTATPETLIAQVKEIPELTPLGEPVPVTIAGFSGLQLDSVALPNPTEEGSPEDDIPPGIQYLPFFMRFLTPGFLWTTSSAEARVRTVALSVGNQTLLLYMEAPAVDFDQFVVDAEEILQSLELVEN